MLRILCRYQAKNSHVFLSSPTVRRQVLSVIPAVFVSTAYFRMLFDKKNTAPLLCSRLYAAAPHNRRVFLLKTSTQKRRVSQAYCSTLDVLPPREKILAFSSKPATYLANTFAQRTNSPYSNEERKTQRARDVCNLKQQHSGDYTMLYPFRLSTPLFSDTFVDSLPPTKATRLPQSNSGHDDCKPCSLCQTNFRVRQRRSA